MKCKPTIFELAIFKSITTKNRLAQTKNRHQGFPITTNWLAQTKIVIIDFRIITGGYVSTPPLSAHRLPKSVATNILQHCSEVQTHNLRTGTSQQSKQ